MDAPAKTDFAVWVERMGYNKKQVTEAGKSIGMGTPFTIGNTYRGQRELSETERRAMTCERLGLPPWTPENDAYLQRVAKLLAAIDEFAAERGPAA